MTVEILMPALSPTMTEGTLAKWHKGEGDEVVAGDVIAEIETDKATMELEAVDEGVLGKIVVAEGSEGVAVNSLIAVLLEEGDDATAADAAASAAPAPQPVAAPEEPVAAPAPAAPQPTAQAAPVDKGSRIFASPLAKRLATEAGIDIAAIPGSGPHGRIVKSDVEAAKAGGVQAAPAAEAQTQAVPTAPSLPATVPTGGSYTEIPNSSIRKIIAERLTASSRDIPSYMVTIDCEIDNLLAMRSDLNGRSPEGDGAYKISVNDFIVRAVALAMRKVPGVNSSWTEAAILQYDAIDISMAVATADGLITPIVRNADQKGLAEISIETKDLALRARDNKLMPEEFQGGGFTISNLGMYGVKEFTSIINPPQSCILSVGAGEQRPVVKEGALGIATVMSCTLASDHRTVDGALAAQFLQAFKAMVEDPLTMLL
ncbi:MAG: pyruvate dehydrogenase complex dihydrolipoamide acetyltransferase [Rhodospirillaceae bacterium]|jgi:pyruvate dehydrogenase E2 component (dihydrolipoamide acetyltransferase)|nr:pyruvate dehydrogenase complex dihydrolipoamide acetyltransferase [Rhodospirillaceae bacterium]MBT5938504.1 pyruvate dehydrogenase complex dihydrolipoamide acetyltransferase [Rhodospirillaceae bacterium]MBT7268666.1 pyruvate dehydrogenase complex dihydrolipoamide acetyltransferase [Rhodospirillaceae bacterium]